MATLAGIDVLELDHTSEPFPVSPGYPFVREIEPKIVTHQFGSGNARIEQKFMLSDGLRRYRVTLPDMSLDEAADLAFFWESCQGGTTTFDLLTPDRAADGSDTAGVARVRFEEP